MSIVLIPSRRHPRISAVSYHCLGIPLELTHQTPDGRPIQVNDDGRLIRELIQDRAHASSARRKESVRGTPRARPE
jgi:hypothetical protein